MCIKKKKAIETKMWLMRNGITQTQIAQRLGVSLSLVSKTIRGDRSNQKVLAALKELGCPMESYSDDN